MPAPQDAPARAALAEPHFLHGMLHWSQLEALWARVRAQPEGWYAVVAGDPWPAEPLDARGLLRWLDDIDATLRREHTQSYCGVVYADDPAAPAYVKIFDPRAMGSFCSCSQEPTPPRWVLSRRRPVAAPAAAGAADRPRRAPASWWRCWLPGAGPR
jgi:hypothetical protein